MFTNSDMGCQEVDWVETSYGVSDTVALRTSESFAAMQITFRSSDVVEGETPITATAPPANSWFLQSDDGEALITTATGGSVDVEFDGEWLIGEVDVDFGASGQIAGSFEIQSLRQPEVNRAVGFTTDARPHAPRVRSDETRTQGRDGTSTETEQKTEYWEPSVASHPGRVHGQMRPFDGGKAMVARCKERRPCAAERWRSTSGETMDILLLERTIHFEDGRPDWPARWMSITGVLRSCMGDPLTVPPTDDPEAVRTLEMTGRHRDLVDPPLREELMRPRRIASARRQVR